MEVLPQGYARPFPGFLDFILSHDELARICAYPEANREWHTNLSAVAGVYLIVYRKTGAQYVGAAYGPGGVMGRWEAYAKDGHGGNKRLKELLEANPNTYKEFHYSLLHTLPKSLTANEVLMYEGLYKTKLGSRAFGLNAN